MPNPTITSSTLVRGTLAGDNSRRNDPPKARVVVRGPSVSRPRLRAAAVCTAPPDSLRP